jgi:flagellar protein FlgJ
MEIHEIKLNINNNAKDNKQNKEIREICQDFESVFISYILKSMRKTIPNSNLGDSSSQEIYTSMMDEELARNVAKGSGIGLADVLFRQFTEKSSKVIAPFLRYKI